MVKNGLLLILIFIVLTSCTQKPSSLAHPLLFEQDFENGRPEHAPEEENYSVYFSDEFASYFSDWDIKLDESGNHVYCNRPADHFIRFFFGQLSWTNYAVEIMVKPIKMDQDPYIQLMARYSNHENPNSYNGSLNFGNYSYDFSKAPIYESFSQGYTQPIESNWYQLKIEVNGDNIRYYINNSLVGEVKDSSLKNGFVNFTLSPNLEICVDDIRVRDLSNEPNIEQSIDTNKTPESKLKAYVGMPVLPIVWSYNDPYDQSYEFKAGCEDLTKDTCFLWNIDNVTVTSPSGEVYNLNKDFSDDVKNAGRWVLYGLKGGGFPQSGKYTFTYFQDKEILLIQEVNYELQLAPQPSNYTIRLDGDVLKIAWTPPDNMTAEMDYKAGVVDYSNFTPYGIYIPRDKRSRVYEYSFSKR